MKDDRGSATADLAIGPLRANLDRAEATFGGVALNLTWAQRSVLIVLLRHRGRVVDRAALYAEAFGRSLAPDSRAIDTHVSRLRRELDKHRRGVILTVGRIGYRIDAAALDEDSGDRPISAFL